MSTQPLGKPFFGYVLISPQTKEQQPKSGIIDKIPEHTLRDTLTGEVIAIGSGSIAFDGSPIPLEVGPGRKVLYLRKDKIDLEIDRKAYHLVEQRDLLFQFYK